MTISHNELVALIAQAAHEHPGDEWAKRAAVLVPDLAQRYMPPCHGRFSRPPFCNEYHAHGLKCGMPDDVCLLCGKTNAEHRTT